jgi:hypothetical protein
VLGRVVSGGAAGVAATAVMTAFLVAAERSGVMHSQPPRMIVDRLLPGLDDRTADRVALVAHAAYGAGAGALHGLLLPRRARRAPSAGIAFGLVLWAFGYEGWLPAIGVLPPAHRDHRGRAATMVLAHVVYGAALARARRTR